MRENIKLDVIYKTNIAGIEIKFYSLVAKAEKKFKKWSIAQSVEMDKDGTVWEHVSISSKSEIPNWKLMCKVKDIFFKEDEVVLQFHPEKSQYINLDKNCLHLWRVANRKLLGDFL